MDYLNYKGKQLPIRVSYIALKSISNDDKVNSVGDIITADVSVLETLLYNGLRAGAAFVDEPFEIEREEVEFILDACFEEFTEMLPRFINDIVKKMGGLGGLTQ